ncbi:malto-oligosyltrehalose trehalohydrolase [Blastopirellula marina]|uniref:Malto-oligosyltrehalose trehalohydrolase n=1 Tax=Blastopirellula marina TaxID=124 RepID=A0A2S8G2R1_9BACT|nr:MULTISPECIES: malto-oligosyltrehalose trehalohydrolase [Pirellulaceae]PQO38742.1 malto-oligosyltrehalose trehalohydrolase [Blastopirellula marina]RCS55050.1 malto-oligosyltrehalose trehalohydrolase [Bremerella cremea]
MLRVFGPRRLEDGNVLFTVHAPACEKLVLQIEGEHAQEVPMIATSDRVFTATASVSPGTRYWFRVPDGNPRPDPASRFQPDGVHGPSQWIDPDTYCWSDQSWRGLPKDQMILYELHIGTFTKEGTYLAAIDRLDELVDLGVTAIEVMPVAQSTGRWNWGYDGTNLFAPRNTFGTPDEFKQLVDTAHGRGIAMILDVVYNHFGAEGNYLHPFGGYVSPRHQTVWGDAPHLDGDGSEMMRDYIVANVRYWIEEFHFDGLRLDATHCILDESPTHIVAEVGKAFAEMQVELERELHLIAESNVYDPELLKSLESGGYGFDAIWCDDFLHAVAAETRPDEHMSDRRYIPGEDIDMVLRRGYVFRGTFEEKRRRIPLAEDSSTANWESLIFSIQNHDFIGNHPDGRRLHQVTSHEAHRAAAALICMLPAIPMLFMGEEFASEKPFYFFADFGDSHLRDAVEKGRHREYPQHDWTDTVSCLSQAAFRKSKIGPREKGSEETLQWYRDLIALRKSWKKRGLFAGAHLQARWDALSHAAILQYQHGDESAFAVIRLVDSQAATGDIHVELSGNVQLTQCALPLADQPGTWALGTLGVLVGEGELRGVSV